MRKGQVKILEQAQRNNYPDVVIKELSRTDLTLKQLDRIYSKCWICYNHDNDWAKAFLNINDEDIITVINICEHSNVSLNASDLMSMTDVGAVCQFFSQDDIICNTIDDVRIVLTLRELSFDDKYLPILFDFACKYYDLVKARDCWSSPRMIVHNVMNNLVSYIEYIDDFEAFINNIDIMSMMDEQGYINVKSLINDYQCQKYDFELKDASGIPADIRSIDFKGYKSQIIAAGYTRKVYRGLKCYSIEYYPFIEIDVSTEGRFYTKPKPNKSKTIMLFYDDNNFVTKYRTKTAVKYKPTQLKELFDAISISDDEEDKTNALSFVDFLCKIYNTYIFRDLYNDYLASGGLLLPCLVKEAAQYHNKRDLMLSLYHCDDLNINLNKRNCNAVYALSKIYKRMTDEAFAKALQIDNIKYQHVGRERCRFAYMIYNALYGTYIANDNDVLLRDAIYDEYNHKSISLLSPNTITERHNERNKKAEAKKVKFSIRKDTKFKTLIDNMPLEYELIKTPERLVAETHMQHNCVALSDFYANKIRNDKSLLYSVIFEDKRHTIEIAGDRGHYKAIQCYKACNQHPSEKLMQELKQILKNINKITA